MLEAPDEENLEQLKARLIQHPATDETWLAVDRHGNNLVHVVAKRAKLQSLLWLADLPFFPQLLTIRNLEGETPLETLEASLESRRTMKQVMLLTVPVADSFGGYAPSDVQCLLVLKGVKKPTVKELAQLTCGCTCGHCIGGFISPRIALALECQGDITGDMLNDDCGFGAGMDGAQWCRWHDHRMSHLEPRVRQNLETNKSMRKGFGNLFFHTAKCIGAKKFPTATNVLAFADGEWPPYTKNYLQRGGTVAAVVLQCFDNAIEQDHYLGDGHHEAVFQDDIDKLPTCRNDGEFIFAQRRYRAIEGIPVEPSSPVSRRLFF